MANSIVQRPLVQKLISKEYEKLRKSLAVRTEARAQPVQDSAVQQNLIAALTSTPVIPNIPMQEEKTSNAVQNSAQENLLAAAVPTPVIPMQEEITSRSNAVQDSAQQNITAAAPMPVIPMQVQEELNRPYSPVNRRKVINRKNCIINAEGKLGARTNAREKLGSVEKNRNKAATVVTLNRDNSNPAKAARSSKCTAVAAVAAGGEPKDPRNGISPPAGLQNDKSNDNQDLNKLIKVVKLLKTWGLKFTGEEDDDAEGVSPAEFLKQLCDCRDSAGVSDRYIFRALPCILFERAGDWYRTSKANIRSWTEFVRSFKRRFVCNFVDLDILDEVHKRTQDKDENITDYLSTFRNIIWHLEKPLSEKDQVHLAYRNLRHDYRNYMENRTINTLEDIEKYGQEMERWSGSDRRRVRLQ